MGAERNDDRLQAVRDERDEHRRRIEEQIAEERADAADHERRERIEQDRGRAYYNVIQIQMTARYRDAERAECYIKRHKQRCRAEP